MDEEEEEEEEEDEDEEEDRSMMTIGEESVDRSHEPVRGAAEGGGRMRTLEVDQGEEEEDDDVELRMAIEASRAALGM